jgi:Fur family peroxide stress response transcriptional regulator
VVTANALRELLTAKGLKITPQRLVITDFLLQEDSHPTADAVYAAVQAMLPACSRATIYNTLNTLVEAEVINAIACEPGKVRYDANMAPHHHFIDRQTGQIFDLPWDSIYPIQATFSRSFRVQDYQVTFYGHHQDESEPEAH